jgi:hypothetical protein
MPRPNVRHLDVGSTVIQFSASSRDGLADDGPDDHHFSLFSDSVIRRLTVTPRLGADALFNAAKKETMKRSADVKDNPVQEPTLECLGPQDDEFRGAPSLRTSFFRDNVCTGMALKASAPCP